MHTHMHIPFLPSNAISHTKLIELLCENFSSIHHLVISNIIKHKPTKSPSCKNTYVLVFNGK